MISLISGLGVVGGSVAALRYFMPRNGIPHSLTIKPLLDSLIPICIVTGITIGGALIVAGGVALSQ
jgi:hypothetical protein